MLPNSPACYFKPCALAYPVCACVVNKALTEMISRDAVRFNAISNLHDGIVRIDSEYIDQSVCGSKQRERERERERERKRECSCTPDHSFHCFKSLSMLENHLTRTVQSSRGGCSRRVHKFVYLAVKNGNILVNFLLLKIFIANYYHL